MTHHYRVYGAWLESGIPFPELLEGGAPGAARWRFDVTPSLEPMREATELGHEGLYGDVYARLHRHADGHRITVDDTGEFDIDRSGRVLRWQDRAASWPDFVRAHLLGRVLSTTLFHDGLLPLHGSAVSLREGTVAFLAPKGFGKSSLAFALTARGAKLVSDDTLPVERPAAAGERPVVRPGLHSVRLHEDAVHALGVTLPGVLTREGKRSLEALPTAMRLEEASPLAALYLLDPLAPTDAAAATREALVPMAAAVGVVAHVKIGRMFGASAAGPMLERAAAIVREVPVYRLRLPRDLATLPAHAERIARWHGGVA